MGNTNAGPKSDTYWKNKSDGYHHPFSIMILIRIPKMITHTPPYKIDIEVHFLMKNLFYDKLRHILLKTHKKCKNVKNKN